MRKQDKINYFLIFKIVYFIIIIIGTIISIESQARLIIFLSFFFILTVKFTVIFEKSFWKFVFSLLRDHFLPTHEI